MLDPMFAFDCPENTAASLLCESLLRPAPDGSTGPGLATLSTPSPKKFVFTPRPGAKFCDGNPSRRPTWVYSLNRAMNSELGGFNTQVFTRVQSIEATGSNKGTINVKQPNYWLVGEMPRSRASSSKRSSRRRRGRSTAHRAAASRAPAPTGSSRSSFANLDVVLTGLGHRQASTFGR